jgi:hypothetical protein
MNTPAHIAHQTPGRLRLAIPSRRGDDGFFKAVAGQLAQSGQITSARGNPVSASLVVEYAGALAPVLADFQRAGIDLTAVAPAGAGAAGAASAGGASWPMEPMLMIGAAFGLVGVVQTVRGEILMPALTAFWYAASALRLAHVTATSASTTSKSIAATAMRANLSAP